LIDAQKNITAINRTVANRTAEDIQFIVLHYVGAVSTAFNNTVYFKSVYHGASAHYFVDETSIWQCVEDKDIAWHCGSETGTYKHPVCRNTNSIGIEMCCKLDNRGDWFIEPLTVKNTIDLTAQLARNYNVPVTNILRHYDVTWKMCPDPWVRDITHWNDFKNKIELKLKLGEGEDMPRYKTFEDLPEWGKPVVRLLILKGALLGDENGNINLSEDMLRVLEINNRIGLYGEVKSV